MVGHSTICFGVYTNTHVKTAMKIHQGAATVLNPADLK